MQSWLLLKRKDDFQSPCKIDSTGKLDFNQKMHQAYYRDFKAVLKTWYSVVTIIGAFAITQHKETATGDL